MKSLLNFFSRNLGLKLLALALALVIYYSMRNSASHTRVAENPFLKGAPNGGNGK